MSSTLLHLNTFICFLCASVLFHHASFAENIDPIRQHQAVILQYHHVSDNTPPSTSVSVKQFTQHLSLIEEQGFDVKPLNEIIERIQNKQPFMQKTLAITFDDGYDSIYYAAYPQLKKRQWPFTVFINPEAIDIKQGNAMSWEQLQEMEKNGANIANHSQQHLHLLKRLKNENDIQWQTRIRGDIQHAQKRLIDKLGPRQKFFAYPYGEFDEALRILLKEEGYIAFSQQSGAINQYSHFQSLPRFPASGVYANLNTLKTKLNSLAFPIISYSPAHAIRNNQQVAPKLTLISQANDIHHKQSQCFYAGKVIPTETQIINNQLTIQAQFLGPLTTGRSRYNCTAPSKSTKGYYWFSIPFIALNNQQEWLD